MTPCPRGWRYWLEFKGALAAGVQIRSVSSCVSEVRAVRVRRNDIPPLHFYSYEKLMLNCLSCRSVVASWWIFTPVTWKTRFNSWLRTAYWQLLRAICWTDASTNREKHTHTLTHTRANTPTHTHTHANKQTDKQIVTNIERSPCVPSGKLSCLDINSTTNARAHVERITSRFHNQQDYNPAATDRKEATSTDAPDAYVYSITGPQRFWNDDLNLHLLMLTAQRKTQRRATKAQATGNEPRTYRFATSSLTCRARPRPRHAVLSRSAAAGRYDTHNRWRNTRATR